MILAVLQARISSTRLPGKVLMPILREPMIVRQIERVARSRRIDKLVVATSDQPADDAIEAAVRREGIAVHRGPLDNVLQRFIGALDAYPADHVVRLTADCPLADPELIDATIDLCLSAGADYASNSPEGAAWPKGLDVEVITAEGLRRAAREADAIITSGGVSVASTTRNVSIPGCPPPRASTPSAGRSTDPTTTPLSPPSMTRSIRAIASSHRPTSRPSSPSGPTWPTTAATGADDGRAKDPAGM